jgi:hypothetical protein
MRADVTGGNWHPPVPSVTPSPHGRKTTPANPFAKKPPQTIRRAGGGQVQLSMQRQREESATAETQSGGITMEEGTNKSEKFIEQSWTDPLMSRDYSIVC